jgi:hypothetical protein
VYLVVRKNPDGSYNFSQKPKVHPNFDDAKKEAERLAGEIPTSTFYVFEATHISCRAPTPVVTTALKGAPPYDSKSTANELTGSDTYDALGNFKKPEQPFEAHIS